MTRVGEVWLLPHGLFLAWQV